jgi:small ligand-binding sensory domain FIST
VLGACLDQLEPLPAGANLGIVYLGDLLAPMADDIVRALSERTGLRQWLGACGSAVLGGPSGASENGLAVLVLCLPEDSFGILPSLGAIPHPCGVVLAHAEIDEADPASFPAELARHPAASVVGGLTAGGCSSVQIADGIMGGAAACLGFAPGLRVLTGMAPAGSPLGPAHQVTSVLGSCILALDGRPALDVMAEELGDLFRRNGRRSAPTLWVAEPRATASCREELRMRRITDIDWRQGMLRLQGGRPGAQVRLMRPDPAGSLARVSELARSLHARLDGRPAAAGLYLASRHRGRALFGPGVDELALLRREFGGLPMIGLATDAEIFDGAIHESAGVLVLIG